MGKARSGKGKGSTFPLPKVASIYRFNWFEDWKGRTTAANAGRDCYARMKSRVAPYLFVHPQEIIRGKQRGRGGGADYSLRKM